MEINELLNKLTLTEEELTEDKIKAILYDANIELDNINSCPLHTMYGDYSCYGDGYTRVIAEVDFNQYVNDLCAEFAQCLPDKFDSYFDSGAMANDINSGTFAVLQQAQGFMKDLGKDVDVVNKVIAHIDDYLVLDCD